MSSEAVVLDVLWGGNGVERKAVQCCGAESICFGSGSDFQKVSAPATALELPVITAFM
jgi:hypothetical protein